MGVQTPLVCQLMLPILTYVNFLSQPQYLQQYQHSELIAYAVTWQQMAAVAMAL